MAVRRATFADVPALRRLFAALAAELEAGRTVTYPTHTPDDLDAFTLMTAQRVEQDPRALLYVAVDDATDEVVGFLGAEIASRVLGTPQVFCAAHWFYVTPAARGQGFARALVRAAAVEVARLGVRHVELGALPEDLQWMRRGWQPFLVHYVLPLEAVVAAATEDRPAAVAVPVPPAPPPPTPPPPLVKPRRRHRRTRPLPGPVPRAAEGGR